jgi:hypothetical protein
VKRLVQKHGGVIHQSEKGESGNPNGRPKSVAVSLTQYIERKYGKRPPKAEVLALMEYIESLSVEHLTEFVKDKGIPAIVQAYGRLLLTGDNKDFRRVQGAEMINDRIHGKPKQTATIGVHDDNVTFVFKEGKKDEGGD